MCEKTNIHANCEALVRTLGERCILYQHMVQDALDLMLWVHDMLERGDPRSAIDELLIDFAATNKEKLKTLSRLEVPGELSGNKRPHR